MKRVIRLSDSTGALLHINRALRVILQTRWSAGGVMVRRPCRVEACACAVERDPVRRWF
jgi:hypothetical protein